MGSSSPVIRPDWCHRNAFGATPRDVLFYITAVEVDEPERDVGALALGLEPPNEVASSFL